MSFHCKETSPLSAFVMAQAQEVVPILADPQEIDKLHKKMHHVACWHNVYLMTTIVLLCTNAFTLYWSVSVSPSPGASTAGPHSLITAQGLSDNAFSGCKPLPPPSPPPSPSTTLPSPPPPTPLSPGNTNDYPTGCYLKECGCPSTGASNSQAPQWCLQMQGNPPVLASMLTSRTAAFCVESKSNCETSCGHVWCIGQPASPSPPHPPHPPSLPPAPPRPPPSPKPPALPPGAPAPGWLTRYWDCCKPSCSWPGKVRSGASAARQCHRDGVTAWPEDTQSPWHATQSVCQDNVPADDAAYVCNSHIPKVSPSDPSVSYVTVATSANNEQATCGACFEITFEGTGHFLPNDPGSVALKAKHKRIIALATNVGYDVTQDKSRQFDVMIPGGGVGAFDGCTKQWERDVSSTAQYGGFLSSCQQMFPNSASDATAHEKVKQCVMRQCTFWFPQGSNLLHGCEWFVTWYEMADNPNVVWRATSCPADSASIWNEDVSFFQTDVTQAVAAY